MGSIVLLDELTINKIAAGEVVDRPASIVKELVENSIDAKASEIIIEIKNGGISYIKIIDNGIGFASDDIQLAFERHATSKIRQETDLLKITSMGFRGEALASIAAVSKVVLVTKNKYENNGLKVSVQAGSIQSIEDVASVIGTKIEIRDVFFNVPARYKFLKKDYTEAGYIEDVIIRIALSNPNIAFKYINNGKVVIQTGANLTLKDTIYDIFGNEIYDNLISLDSEYNNVNVDGVIGLQTISRSTRMHQFTYINSRYIKDKVINSAIDKACQQKYPINKYPFIILNIKLDPCHIDVNAHPAKLEVKFDDENLIFQSVYNSVNSALVKYDKLTSPFSNIIDKTLSNVDTISPNLIKVDTIKEEKEIYNIKTQQFDFDQNSLKENNTTLMKSNDEIIPKDDHNISESVDTKYIVNKSDNILKNIDPRVESVENNMKISDNIKSINENCMVDEILYKYIGQVFNTYIIIQIKEKIYIVDQHAAHERLLFEKIKISFYSTDKQSQMLLIPFLVELSQKETQIVKQNIELFAASGFVLEEFGENTIKISGVPNIGYEIEYKSMFKDIIDELLGASKTQKSEKEFRFIATIACKAAVKGNMKLDEYEQIQLIDDMMKLENPFTCPHGRPTAFEISKYEIEKKFLRK